MLVLSRRADQSVVLPEIGVSIDVLSVRGNTVRIGVRAPLDLRIVRGELQDSKAAQSQSSPRRTYELSNNEFHALQNQLNSIGLGLQLLRKQRGAGLTEDAESTLERVFDLLNSLATNLNGFSPKELVTAPTALLIEDDANERELLAALLRISGYQVVTTVDGHDALEYLESNELPAVVLMDMRMPRCDGPTTVRRIRANSKLANLAVFAVSATEPSALGVPMGSDGIDGWFAKPIDADSLTTALGHVTSV